MNIIAKLRTDLAEAKRGEIELLADAIGIPRDTFRKIVDERTKHPRYDAVMKIEAYYASLSSRVRRAPRARPAEAAQ